MKSLPGLFLPLMLFAPLAQAQSPTVPPPQADDAARPLPPMLTLPGDGHVPAVRDAAAEAAHYRDCLETARRDPAAALAASAAWQAAGGGLAAKHCAAVAFIGQDSYREGIARLNAIAEDLRLGRELPYDPLGPADARRLLAEVYAQIGNAWLLAGDPSKAYTALSQGLAEAPLDDDRARVELYIDRARALAETRDFTAALADLEEARALAATRSDILLFMASAYRALDRLAEARDAIARAIDLAGEGPEAVLIRGNIAFAAGDLAAARRDWQAVVTRWPESAAAGLARVRLDALAGATAEETDSESP